MPSLRCDHRTNGRNSPPVVSVALIVPRRLIASLPLFVLSAIMAFSLPCPAQTNFVVLANDGAWTWYNDPRALFHQGLLYFGYVRNSDGKTVLSVFNPHNGAKTDLWTSALSERDDHNVPSLLVRRDDRMLAVWSRHNTDRFFSYRISNGTNTQSPTDWGAEERIPATAAGMTYANVFQLSDEGGRIYDFARNLNFNPTVFVSTNGGGTWSAPRTLIQTGGGSVRPYVKFCSDSKSRIDFLYTDGHPRDVTNSLYHMYYERGAFYRTDGALVKSFDHLPILHDGGESGSVIYAYNEAQQDDPNQWIPSGRAWCWQITSPERDHPVCVFTVRARDVTGTNWNDARIYYYYARWTGTNWQKRFIAHAGRPLYQAEGDYAGGICLDPDDPNVVYLSSDAAEPFALRDTKHVPLRPQGRFELWRGETSDGGQTFRWRELTANSAVDNLRPFVPYGRHDFPALLWFRGDYRRYTSFQCEIVGLFSNSARATAGANVRGENRALTNAAQVRALTQAEASEHFPVKLRGIVIGEAEPEGESFAMMDSTAGIYLRGAVALVSRIRHGDVVEVEGYSDPGEFAPFVQLTSLRKTGHEPVPEPRAVSFEQLVTGRPDAQWVEVSGVVRSCDALPGRKYKVELATGGGRLSVQIDSPLPLENPIDAEVRLRGVCYYQVNNTRQVLSPLLLVPREVPVIVNSAPPTDPYGEPVRSIGSLLQFAPQGSYGHRVHVRGVVTHSDHGKSIWIRDDTQGLRVHVRQADVLEPGDVVDVLGFPNRGDYTPVLEDGVFQKRASAATPAPIHLRDAASALNFDAALIEVPAVLMAWQEAADGWVLVLDNGGVTFRALLRSDARNSLLEKFLPGSRVRVTGICSVLAGEESPPTGLSAPHSFQILLRSPSDLAIVQPPPWWTWERVVWLLGAVVGGLLLVVAIVMSVARRRLREKTIERARAEAEFTAILAERNRMAREIHDTLAQGLGAISMQLELVKGGLAPDTNGAGKHLEQARQLVRDSLADARNSIWNMRSQVLETGDLASALSGILRQLAGGTSVEANIRVIGEPRRLPPITENNLLRIGQEAITNAMKHAQPRHLAVELEFAGKEVRLRVTDDGKGFDTAAPPTSRTGFGLMGIRERTDELRGALTLESRPGDGTQLTLVVPVTTTS